MLMDRGYLVMQMNWPFLVTGKSHKLISDINGSNCYVLVMLIYKLLLVMLTNRENRQNLHVFNLWPVKYHTEKNSCANPTPGTLSVELYTSQQDYPKSAHFYFAAIYISQQKAVPV